MRPQPTRAPRDEVMALSPLRGRELAGAVARGPTLEWGGGVMARGTAAVALRLPLAPGLTGTVARDSAPSLPPPAEVSKGLTKNVNHLTGEQGGQGAQRLKVAASPRPSLPTPVPSLTEVPTVGRAGSEFRLPGSHGGRMGTGRGRQRARTTPARASTKTNGGASHGTPDRPPPPPDSIPVAPRADGGGYGGGLTTGGFPHGMGLDPGPSMRQEGVYMPTAHEGAPQRGDGSGPLLAVGSA